MNTMREDFQQILQQPDAFAQMRAEMIQLRLEGVTKDAIYTSLQALRAEVNELQADIILEALDLMVGFCSPRLRID